MRLRSAILVAFVLFVTLVLVPLAAEAQRAAKVPRIGYLGTNRASAPHLGEAFLQGLTGCAQGRCRRGRRHTRRPRRQASDQDPPHCLPFCH